MLVCGIMWAGRGLAQMFSMFNWITYILMFIYIDIKIW